MSIRKAPAANGAVTARPAYQQIKDYVLDRIQSGGWREGAMISSEEEMTRQFSVSRMTVNRALRELTAEQVLHRVQGLGTFVAQRKYQSTVVEIRNIAAEITARGNAHSATVLRMQPVQADAATAGEFDIARRTRLFHSVILHRENGAPVQIEDRHVNPKLFPDYMTQDFTRTTPNEYLTATAPIQKVEFRVEALMPDATLRGQLAMEAGTPCLVLHRRTWSFGQVATVANLWHPGSRYSFTGSF
ncbi:MAG TPA: histidine utilization repressor [Roseomonas sp.]|jgi:GntR family histidine utilization transcriptional repressor